MSKGKKSTSKKEASYPYPSQFGSHSSMVVLEETKRLADPDLVVCKDEFGLYLTKANRLDSGLADPLRNSDPERRKERLEEAVGQVINIIG
jgi:hypothetical protein